MEKKKLRQLFQSFNPLGMRGISVCRNCNSEELIES